MVASLHRCELLSLRRCVNTQSQEHGTEKQEILNQVQDDESAINLSSFSK